MLEGPHVVASALDAGIEVEELFFEAGADQALVARARQAGIAVHELERGTLARITDAVSPQPVLAVAPWCAADLDTVVVGGTDLRRPVVVLHELRDPGNVGTLLRTAEASGAASVVICGQSADIFNPKCVRASAGALFNLPVAVAEDDGVTVLGTLREAGLRLVGTDAGAPTSYAAADLTGAVAFVLGNEASGLPAAMLSAVDEVVAVPIEGRAESLNVAAVGAVLCFEAARQRREQQP